MLGDIQYSTVYPVSVTDKDHQGKLKNLFEKIDVDVHPGNIEAIHWIKSNTGPKKLSLKCLDANMQIKFKGKRKN